MIVFFVLLIVIAIIAGSSTREFVENASIKESQQGNGQVFYIDGKGRARLKSNNQHVTVRNGEVREIGTDKVLYDPVVADCNRRNLHLKPGSLGKWGTFRGKYMSCSKLITIEKSTGKPYTTVCEYDWGKGKNVINFYYVFYTDSGTEFKIYESKRTLTQEQRRLYTLGWSVYDRN